MKHKVLVRVAYAPNAAYLPSSAAPFAGAASKPLIRSGFCLTSSCDGPTYMDANQSRQRQQVSNYRARSSVALMPAPVLAAGRITIEGAEMVMPGENFRATVELGLPVAMEPGLRFAIR